MAHGWALASALFHRADNFGDVERKTAERNTDHVAFVYGGSASARKFKDKASVGHRTDYPTRVVLLSAGLRQHDDSTETSPRKANKCSPLASYPSKSLGITRV